jgi:hypothetical protein
MFVEEWKDARKAFETATQKKKPCEKFIGLFNKSTGILNAVKELDESLKSREADRMMKAEDVFAKVKGDYTPILLKAAKEDKGCDYIKETQKLGDALDDIADLFAKTRKSTEEQSASVLAATLIKSFVTVMKAAAPVQKQAAAAKRQAVLDNGACSDALTAIVLAGGQADAAAVQQAFGVIKEKAKAIDAAIATNTAVYQKIQAAFAKACEDFKKAKDDLPKKQHGLVQGQSDAAETVVSQISTLIGMMKDELENTKGIIKDAGTTAKDATKHAELLVKTSEQLAHRASELATPMVAARQDIDGKLDQQKGRIKDELKDETDPQKRKMIADNIKMKLTHIRQDAEERGQESADNAKELYVAVARVPPNTMANDNVKGFLDRVTDSLDSLEKSEGIFKEVAKKADALLTDLAKL